MCQLLLTGAAQPGAGLHVMLQSERLDGTTQRYTIWSNGGHLNKNPQNIVQVISPRKVEVYMEQRQLSASTIRCLHKNWLDCKEGMWRMVHHDEVM